MNRSVVTCFEDLSNELFYEIFDFLDSCFTYETFFNLNTRFNQLIIHSSVPLKLNFSLLSKSTFQHRCNHILMPNIYRIISIRLSNHLLIDQFFTTYFLDSTFIRLEAFTLDNIKSDNLIPILSSLVSLPRLHSLTITSIERIESSNVVYYLIIRLPVLKYCKLSFGLWNQYDDLSLINEQCSPIEHLIINDKCNLSKLTELLTHTPKLNRLSCKISTLNSSLSEASIIPTNLYNISLKLEDTSFDEFEWFISNFSHRLEILSISAEHDIEFLNADRWQRLISHQMPLLYKFCFQYQTVISENFDDYDQCHDLMKNFNSSFWHDRQWFFTHQHYKSKYAISSIRFYSIQPYKWNRYEFLDDTCQQNETGLNLAYEVDLHNYQSISSYSIQFPRTSRLILSEGNINENSSFIDNLTCIFSPIHLTELIIFDENIRLEQLSLILHYFPNIKSLTIPTNILYLTSKQTELNRLIFNKTNIIKLIILNQCRLEDIQICIRFCPYLQNLEIEVEKEYLESILHFLLLKNTNQNNRNRFLTHLYSKNVPFWQDEYFNCIDCTKNQNLNSIKFSLPCNHHLSSLCCRNINYRMIEKIRTMINRETLLNDYSMEYIDQTMYLWW